MIQKHPNAPKIVAITQARTGSSRLPGKILRAVAGKTLLEHHVARLLRARRVDGVVVATTTEPGDDAVAELCARCGYHVFRGDEADVLARYAGAAEAFDADVIVRVTSDCPLIDPGLVDDLVELFGAADPPFDYAAIDTRSYPRGLDAEIFSRKALEAAFREADDPAEREHVTPFIYNRPKQFRLGALRCPEAHTGHRWCVDEAQDLDFISRLLPAALAQNPNFTWRDCLQLLDRNPEWMAINRDVRQKKI